MNDWKTSAVHAIDGTSDVPDAFPTPKAVRKAIEARSRPPVVAPVPPLNLSAIKPASSKRSLDPPSSRPALSSARSSLFTPRNSERRQRQRELDANGQDFLDSYRQVPAHRRRAHPSAAHNPRRTWLPSSWAHHRVVSRRRHQRRRELKSNRFQSRLSMSRLMITRAPWSRPSALRCAPQSATPTRTQRRRLLPQQPNHPRPLNPPTTIPLSRNLRAPTLPLILTLSALVQPRRQQTRPGCARVASTSSNRRRYPASRSLTPFWRQKSASLPLSSALRRRPAPVKRARTRWRTMLRPWHRRRRRKPTCCPTSRGALSQSRCVIVPALCLIAVL